MGQDSNVLHADDSAPAIAGGRAALAPDLCPHIPSLDGLRAVSIALVLLAHVAGTRGAPAFLDRLGHIGNLGVKVFFVISGFLITTLLLREFEREGRISLRGFYFRRAVRIFPAFYAYVGIVFLLQLFGRIALAEGDLLHALTYTMNYKDDRGWYLNHLWSLSVEEQFYLLWPPVLYLFGPRRALTWAVAAVLLAPAARGLMWYGLDFSRSAMTRQFQAVADSLAAGCLVALCYNRLGTIKWYRALLSSRYFLVLPFGMLALTLIQAQRNIGLYYCVGQSVVTVAIALCVDRYVRFPETRGGRALNSRPFVVVGILSYSLYLWQELFLNPMDEVSFFTAFPQNVVFALLAAAVSYRLVERPFLLLKPGRTRPSARPAPEGSAALSVVPSSPAVLRTPVPTAAGVE